MTKPHARTWQRVGIVFYATDAGNIPARDLLEALPAAIRGQIAEGIETFSRYGERSPISWKWIKGHTPMREIRVGGYRVLFVVKSGSMIVLEACKKQNQEAAIERAAARMKLI